MDQDEIPPDELTAAEIELLRTKLLDLIRGTESVMQSTHEGGKPVALDTPIGRLSRMDALQAQGLAQVHHDRAEIRLRQAKAALKRIEQNEYGWCLKCHDPIGFKRLNVNPEGPICLICIRRSE